MPNERRTSRQLVTPSREGSRVSQGGPRRSRSRIRQDKNSDERRSRLRERSSRRDYDWLLEEERRLDKERELLRAREDELYRERSRIRRTVSNQRDNIDTDTTEPRREYLGRSSDKDGGPDAKKRRIEIKQSEGRSKRSSSPTFSAKDVINILNTLKNVQSQPSTSAATISSNNHKNILPEFDPSSKNQRIDLWLKKVNECATVYGWDDKTIIHFAMQKLQGLAKTWYESLPSILFDWKEWQEKLSSAFPWEQNYGQTLEDMLKRKSRYGEPIEVYYYEKLALLNQCNIDGKRAVDCIIHGLSDKTMRSSAVALRCSNPEQLLQFLMSSKESFQYSERFSQKIKPNSEIISKPNNNFTRSYVKTPNTYNNNIFCFNCKEKGHPFTKCPKPIIKCDECYKIGHTKVECPSKNNKTNQPDLTRKAMCISGPSNSNSKFYKVVQVNNVMTNAFVDFGSEVSLMKCSNASALGLTPNNESVALKGFGNDMVKTLGNVSVNLTVDGVSAKVVCHVVGDQYLEQPLLIGQSFTEQSHVVVYKNAEQLNFIDVGREMPFSESDIQQNDIIKLTASGFANIYGPAFVRASVEPKIEGSILLDDKIIGRPTEQFMVMGGVYRVKQGLVDIQISPVSAQSRIYDGMVIGRGLEVKVVNRIFPPTAEVDSNCTIREDQIHIGKQINGTQKQRLVELLNKYKHCFASSLHNLGCTKIAEMTIEVTNSKPIVYRPYRLSHKEREDVREMIKEMIDAGIVRESVSEYASPIILVRKKDGKIRMCIDYRMLNSVTVKERYPMPNIEDEIARLTGQAYFVTLDLTSGYYQVPIAEESRPLTSFVTPDGQYEFNRMPFGLANAPAVFQRMMHKVLGSARYNGATAYIDDVLIYGKDVEECLTRLEYVLQLLESANLTLNLSKCDFLKEQIDYLGYEISAAGVRPGTKKIQCVLDFPCPADQHGVRQFLGLVGYFRKFIRNFATIAHPLTTLLSKDAAWTWGREQEEAFTCLKERLVNRPILAIYDPLAETELHTDASKWGVGGVLLQRSQGTDSFRPVAFYSRKTSPEEKNFHAYELETLAVVCSLKKFRVYLIGKDFKIVTDCSALRSTFSKRDILPRVARWWLLLQEFQCTVEYRAGVKMSHVDALSRNPISDAETAETLDNYPSVMTISSEDWLQTLQLGDAELGRIRVVLASDLDGDKLKYIHDNYIMKDNKLYRYLDGDRTNLRWVVPKGARWQLCRINHDDIGHFGVEKTLERIKKFYWFPKMTKFVKKYVNACIECAYAKKTSTSKEGHLHPIEKVDIPFHTLHVDHLGPFIKSKRGNTHLLVIIDGFTKFVFIKPVRNTKTESAVRVLTDVFDTFRAPDRIISDRGTCFTSHAFRRFCLNKGMKHVLNAVASPRSNGQVERYNRTILDSLTAQNLNRDEREWDDVIGKIQWGLNNTFQKTIGRTPAEVMFGTAMNSEANPKLNEVLKETREGIDLTIIREEVKDKIDTQQEKQKQNYDKNRRPARVYTEGELVKITKTMFSNDGKSKKLLPSYIGPYRVVAVLGNDRYRVAAIPGLTGTKNKRQTTVAADRMLPWVNVAALDVNDSDSSDSDSQSSNS